MSDYLKKTDDISVDDFAISPIWEYLNWEDNQVQPVHALPVESLLNRIVGVEVQLKNGERTWAALSRISLNNARRTQEFLVAWFEREGEWFELARYHDVDYDRRGPYQLASFLGLPIDDVFPIEYDITAVAIGDPSVLRGIIHATPEVHLTDEQRIALTFEEK